MTEAKASGKDFSSSHEAAPLAVGTGVCKLLGTALSAVTVAPPESVGDALDVRVAEAVGRGAEADEVEPEVVAAAGELGDGVEATVLWEPKSKDKGLLTILN